MPYTAAAALCRMTLMYVACLLVGTDLASIIVGKSVENGRFLG